MKKIFSVSGVVVNWKREWRTFWFPTANLKLKEKLDYKYWVYVVKVFSSGNQYIWVLNYWVRPNFDDGAAATFEVYILDFDEDIYDTELRVEAYNYIREQRKFENQNAFLEQYQKDVEATQAYFKKYQGSFLIYS